MSPSTPLASAAIAALPPVRRAGAFLDVLLAVARPIAPLVEFLRAHLDAAAHGAARTAPEHLVDLVTLGLRWRLHARATLRRPWARPDHDDVRGLLARLRAAGVPAAEVSRLATWNEFALDEGCPEVLDDAVDLAIWFERAAGAALGTAAPGLEAQLELMRTEVLSRALRGRRQATPPPPRLGAPGRPTRPFAAGQPGDRREAPARLTAALGAAERLAGARAARA